MSNKLAQAAAFFQHIATAIPLSELPEPLSFWQGIFQDSEQASFAVIEARRKELCYNHLVIDVEDMGARYSTPTLIRRKISRIAATSMTPPFWGQAFFRLAQAIQPRVAIELGTSLGVNAAYIAQGCPEARFFTLEGSPQIAAIAAKTLQSTQAEIVVGDIARTLPEVLGRTEQVDLVFFDANHAYRPTLDYFEMCLAKSSATAVFVFDDIYWSRGMALAWQQIERWPGVVASLDFFTKGVVLFDPKLPEVHLRVKSGERVLI